MDSDWLSAFYHSTAGRKKKKIVLKVIPMISFLYIMFESRILQIFPVKSAQKYTKKTVPI